MFSSSGCSCCCPEAIKDSVVVAHLGFPFRIPQSSSECEAELNAARMFFLVLAGLCVFGTSSPRPSLFKMRVRKVATSQCSKHRSLLIEHRCPIHNKPQRHVLLRLPDSHRLSQTRSVLVPSRSNTYTPSQHCFAIRIGFSSIRHNTISFLCLLNMLCGT